MRSSNGRVCSWFQWPRIVLSLPLFLSLSLAVYLPICSYRLAHQRVEKQERESRARYSKRHEGRTRWRERKRETEREKQVVRGSSVRETFDLVEIPLISSVPLHAMKRERRVGRDTGDRDLSSLRFLTVRDVNYSRVSNNLSNSIARL